MFASIELIACPVVGGLFAVSASLVVFPHAQRKYGSLAAVAAITIGNLGSVTISLITRTIPSNWRAVDFWDTWLETFRWDWWTAQAVGFALLFGPLGVFISILSMELYSGWNRKDPPSKEPDSTVPNESTPHE